MLCGSLDGKGVWGRMDTYICKNMNFGEVREIVRNRDTWRAAVHGVANSRA